ncbi:MAG TPA: hypothetical protein VJV78_36175 [Polyangiales bacterium]|nr:hypothetical protein [Polyangiales bacterium]
MEYSSDEGANWQIIAIDYDANSLPLEVPGCKRGRLRVTVSDGFHSVTREVGPFRVPGRPPEISISSPTNDSETLREDQSMKLEAEVFDPDEGSLEDDALRWVSDRSGELGRGRISIGWRDLRRGRHVITATATDSSGMSTSASFRLDVVHAEKPPVVARRRTSVPPAQWREARAKSGCGHPACGRAA